MPVVSRFALMARTSAVRKRCGMLRLGEVRFPLPVPIRLRRRTSSVLKVFRRGRRSDRRCRAVVAHVDKPRKEKAAGAGRHLWGKCGIGGACCLAHGLRR